MTDSTPETPHFGFTRVGAGEDLSKNGFAFSDLDRVTLDSILYAAFNHKHDGVPALGSPTYPPTMVAIPTSGVLPAATTYYYRVSYMDENGLETAAGPEGSVTTPPPVPPPTAPGVSVVQTGGTVIPGAYSYLITYTDSYGGETTPSAASIVTVNSGTFNQIRLALPDLIENAEAFNIYRSRPGQSAFYQIDTAITGIEFYDDGIAEDQTITAPTVNTTNSANAIEVTIPGPPGSPFVPLGCVSWRIYRASSSGGYDGNSLVHNVTEGALNTSTTPVIMHTDTGDALLAGIPQEISSTLPPSPILNAAGISGAVGGAARGQQVYTAFCAGTPTNGQTVSVTKTASDMLPVRFTAHFQTPPGSEIVTFTVADTSSHSLALPCSSSTHVGGDPAGFFHVEFSANASLAVEAEAGTRSSGVLLQNDVTASSGQAVNLSAQNHAVTLDIGSPAAGTYHAAAVVKVLAYDLATTNDLIIEIVNVSSSAVIASQSFTLATTSETGYLTRTGPDFVAPGGVALALRVRKTTTSSQSYLIDNGKYNADIPDLHAGLITITASISGGSTSAANANLALWF